MRETQPCLHGVYSLTEKKLNKCTTHHFFWIVIIGTRTSTECFESIDQGLSPAGKGRGRNQGKLPRERNIWGECLRMRGKLDRKREQVSRWKERFLRRPEAGSSLAHCWKQEPVRWTRVQRAQTGVMVLQRWAGDVPPHRSPSGTLTCFSGCPHPQNELQTPHHVLALLTSPYPRPPFSLKTLNPTRHPAGRMGNTRRPTHRSRC